MCVCARARVSVRIGGGLLKAPAYRCVFGGWDTKREDWGVIQSLHKWIWIIEGASDPDWCTAGAPLIGEGEEWRREWRGWRKGEHGPRRKCTSAAALAGDHGSIHAAGTGAGVGKQVMRRASNAEGHFDGR